VSGRLSPPAPVPAATVAERTPPGPGSILEGDQLILSDTNGTPRDRLSVPSEGTPLTVELGVLADTGAVLRLNGDSRSSPADVVFQAPSNVARLLPPDIWP
jgi:hypothetical protein